MRKERPVLDAVQGRDQQPGAGHRQPVEEISTGVGWAHRFGDNAVDRPRIQLFLDLERGCTGEIVAGQDGVLHRRRAAPRRQQREVQVDPTVLGHVERRSGQQPAVGNDWRAVGADLGEPNEKVRVSWPLRPEYFYARVRRRLRHRARAELPSATSRSVRPGEDRYDVVARVENGPQRRQGGLGGSREDESHRHDLGPIGAASLTMPGRRSGAARA